MVGIISYASDAVAETHSGALEEETQRAFVQEVQRVGHDPIYWVRREASFALGALAKVVPDDVVIGSLVSSSHLSLLHALFTRLYSVSFRYSIHCDGTPLGTFAIRPSLPFLHCSRASLLRSAGRWRWKL